MHLSRSSPSAVTITCGFSHPFAPRVIHDHRCPPRSYPISPSHPIVLMSLSLCASALLALSYCVFLSSLGLLAMDVSGFMVVACCNNSPPFRMYGYLYILFGCPRVNVSSKISTPIHLLYLHLFPLSSNFFFSHWAYFLHSSGLRIVIPGFPCISYDIHLFPGLPYVREIAFILHTPVHHQFCLIHPFVRPFILLIHCSCLYVLHRSCPSVYNIHPLLRRKST